MFQIYRYKQILWITGLLAAMALTVTAQQKKPAATKATHWDVLYLKNGSVIKGTFLPAAEGRVKIETRAQDTLMVEAQEVDHVGRELKPLRVSPRGFYGIMEAGIQFSGNEGAVFRAIGGYRFGYQWQAGAGIGLDDYTIRSVPVFADLRYDFSRKAQTLFAYAGAGIAIPWPTDKQLILNDTLTKKTPGLYAHAGLGYKIRWRHGNSLHISAGYAHTAMKIEYPRYDWITGRPLTTYTTYNYSYNRVTIMLGYSF